VRGYLQPAGLRPGVIVALRDYLRTLPGVTAAEAHPLIGYLDCRVRPVGDDSVDIACEVKKYLGADLTPGLNPVFPRQWARLAAAAVIHACVLILAGSAPSLVLPGALAIAAAMGLGYPLLLRSWRALQHRRMHGDLMAAAGLGMSIVAVPLAWQGYLPPSSVAWPTLIMLTELALATLHCVIATQSVRRLDTAGIPVQSLVSRLKQQELSEQAAHVMPWLGLATGILAFCGWWALGPAHSISRAAASALAVILVCSGDGLLASLPAMTAWGTFAAAARRIFWHDTGTLERLWLTGVTVFSKSGVLTEGRPRVSAVVPCAGWTCQSVVRLAAGVASPLTHPVALAIRDEAARLHLDLPDASECDQTRFGLSGTIEGIRVHAGLPAWIAHGGIQLGELADDAARAQTEGKSAIVVARDGAAIGLLVMADRLRRDSVSAMRILQRMGIRPALVTSDSAGTARTIAEQLGIRHAAGDADEAKRRKVLQRAQEDTIGTVAYVSNQACSDDSVLPIVLGDAAAPSGGVSLADGTLTGVADALLLARAIQRRAVFAQVANAIALVALIPAAAFGLVGPGAAAVLAITLEAATCWHGRRILAFNPGAAAARLLRKREMLERI
ncbi:MAG: cation-translocating P-type ATPase, partial [Candidatus Hydrogenedentes bacterium]|nr:cation-translocating P-type ATPase [Candidatus Hydrogenedentota bacterium]